MNGAQISGRLVTPDEEMAELSLSVITEPPELFAVPVPAAVDGACLFPPNNGTGDIEIATNGSAYT